MKIGIAFGFVVLAGLALAALAGAASRQAQIICAEDVLPDSMVVTATGTSPVCKGSCRARRMEPVGGAVMIICGNQAIPKNYTLDSITTTPDCQCLGNEDNAYVIRKLEVSEGDEEEGEEPAPQPTARFTPTPAASVQHFRIGE